MAPLYTILFISLLFAGCCNALLGTGNPLRRSDNTISRITNRARLDDEQAQGVTDGSSPSLLELFGPNGVSSKLADIEAKHEKLLAQNAVLQQRLDESERRNQKLDALIGKLEGIFGSVGSDGAPDGGGVGIREHEPQEDEQNDGLDERIQTLSDLLGNREAELVAYNPDPVMVNENKAVKELRDQLSDGAKKTLDLLERSLLQMNDRTDSMESDIRDMKRKLANKRSMSSSDTLTNSISPNLERNERSASSATSGTVLFAAAATSSQYGTTSPQTVEFQDVMENNGGDFVSSNHTFVCEVPGWYYFSFTLRTIDNFHLGVILMKNQSPMVSVYTDSSERNTMESQSTILELVEGDAVWLRLGPSTTYGVFSDSYRYSTFTGFLVYPSS